MPLLTTAAISLEMVARHGSIRKAAELMNTSPSALNRQIINLEHEYGQMLFDRLPRGMRPNKAGKILITQIRKWQLETVNIDAELDGLRSDHNGTIRVGVMECLVAEFLPSAFRELRNRFPHVKLEVLVGGTEAILGHIKKGTVDLAVAFNTPKDSGVSIVCTSHLALGVIVAPSHPLAVKTSIKIEDIADQDFVSADPALTIGSLTESIFLRQHASVRKIASANSIASIKTLVQDGMGLCILTELDVREEVKKGELCFIPLSLAHFSTSLSLFCRDPDALTDVGKAMSTIIVAQMQALEV
ncbi:LysR family transcriptional regulator [Pacificibacter marinus]|uniref:HTH-type transcriptional regulator GltC n=1 Tax=Pacificibacter marinus TaxID=658057 RepID=A0A1Y5T5Q0_9RHOB|nr:LysR family transcriptional regulator [Pacificibacter marinus]SEL21974.1 DNA-binding transcriptional regulator, LysR family [Pacificibacter marinus]SLN56539.1 HTH-type transcriptional regulator GltC [Pacificibacter marinus]